LRAIDSSLESKVERGLNLLEITKWDSFFFGF
jgi:hypothetical protein